MILFTTYFLQSPVPFIRRSYQYMDHTQLLATNHMRTNNQLVAPLTISDMHIILEFSELTSYACIF